MSILAYISYFYGSSLTSDKREDRQKFYLILILICQTEYSRSPLLFIAVPVKLVDSGTSAESYITPSIHTSASWTTLCRSVRSFAQFYEVYMCDITFVNTEPFFGIDLFLMNI